MYAHRFAVAVFFELLLSWPAWLPQRKAPADAGAFFVEAFGVRQ
jgi:hypothetical protein